jgi:hypothetical protein
VGSFAWRCWRWARWARCSFSAAEVAARRVGRIRAFAKIANGKPRIVHVRHGLCQYYRGRTVGLCCQSDIRPALPRRIPFFSQEIYSPETEIVAGVFIFPAGITQTDNQFYIFIFLHPALVPLTFSLSGRL